MQTPLWRPVVLRHRGRGGIQESEERFAHRRTFGSWSRFGSWQRGVGGGCWGCAPGVSVDARQHPAALWSPSLQQRNIGPRLCWGSEMLIQTQILGIFLWLWVRTLLGLPWWLNGQESTCQCRRHGLDPWVGKIPLEKEMTAHSNILAWEIPLTEEPGGLKRWTQLSDLTTTTVYTESGISYAY